MTAQKASRSLMSTSPFENGVIVKIYKSQVDPILVVGRLRRAGWDNIFHFLARLFSSPKLRPRQREFGQLTKRLVMRDFRHFIFKYYICRREEACWQGTKTLKLQLGGSISTIHDINASAGSKLGHFQSKFNGFEKILSKYLIFVIASLSPRVKIIFFWCHRCTWVLQV